LKDKREVLNYFEALQTLDTLTSEKRKYLTQADVLQIQSIITRNVVKRSEYEGKYRSGNQYVLLRNKASGEITFLPPPTHQVPQLMGDLLKWINENEDSALDPVLEAGIAHYEFVRIHPFLDGNGRTARTLATLILMRRSFDTKRFFALDDFYNSDRPRYYQVLRSVHQDDYDLTSWLEYFCEGVAVAMKAVKDKVISLGNKKKAHAQDKQVALDYEQIKIIEYVTKQSSIQNKAVQELFQVSNKKAYQLLHKLVKLDVLVPQGAGRSLKYILR
jgi:Fic family protein